MALPVKLILLAIAGIWMLGWLPNLFIMLESGRVVNESLSKVSRSTDLSHSISAALGLLIGFSLFFAVVGSSRRPAVNGWYPIVLIAPWVALYVGHFVLHEGGFDYREIIYPLFIVAVYFVCPRVPDICRFIARLVILTACVALAMAFTMQSIAFMPAKWNDEKVMFGDSILAGPYAHSNQIGTSFVLAVPLIYASYTGWRRIIYLALVVATLIWSTSRISLISGVAFIVALVVINVVRSTAVRKRLLQMAIALALFVAVELPIITDDPQAYSNRGNIWQQSLHYWSLSPLTGWGPDIFSEPNFLTRAIGAYPNSAHNIWLTFGTMGGVLGLIAIAAMFGSIVHRSSEMYIKGEARPLFFILVLALMEIAEEPLRGLHLGPQSFIVWGGLILVMCRMQDDGTSDQIPEIKSADLSMNAKRESFNEKPVAPLSPARDRRRVDQAMELSSLSYRLGD